MFFEAVEKAGYESVRRNFRYYVRKRGIALSDDEVDDVFQDRLLYCQEMYLAGKLPVTTRPLHYFYRALANRSVNVVNSLNRYNSKHERVSEETELFEELFDIPAEVDPDAFWDEANALAVHWKLDPHAWAGLKYMLHADATYKEVAELLGWSESHAWNRIKALKTKLNGLWNQPQS